MKLSADQIIESVMQKYELPQWIKPYVHRYVKENPLSSIKFAISLIDVKRKKGEVTKTHVKLPNGKSFKIDSIIKVLNLFFYGEEEIAHIEKFWGSSSVDHNAEYEKNFLEISELDSKYTRAIKNLVEGLGYGVGEKPDSIITVFDNISRIEPWRDRVLTTGIILHYSYAKTFGTIFYKVFYPVSPEFMRSFGKAFKNNNPERWDTEEATKLIQNSLLEKEHILELTRELLAQILFSINSNIDLAKELGVEREVKLLSEISIAYPFQKLLELGVELDVESEVKTVKNISSKLKK